MPVRALLARYFDALGKGDAARRSLVPKTGASHDDALASSLSASV